MIRVGKEFKKLIPPLSTEEYQQLEQNIISEGCRDALVVWDEIILDGHNRYDICTKHNIEYRVHKMEFDTEDEAMDWMDKNQLGRRNLTPDQRRIIIGRRYNREKKSYGGDRKSSGHFDHLKTESKIAEETGSSSRGVRRYAKEADLFKTIEEKEPEIAKKIWHGEINLADAKKESRKHEIQQQRQEIADRGALVSISDRYEIIQADMRTWETDKKYDWIITDPPYPREFLSLWENLALNAIKWLKPGGLLVAMSGQMYLDEIYTMLGKHLTYYWTGAYLTPGQPTPLRHRNVNTTWKPMLIYSNGDYKGKIFGDVWKSEANDKGSHKWGQSESGMRDIISKLCLAGESILDPFCGAGTTGIAAIEHGCFFTGLEIDEDNVNISKGRLSR